jgi:hypothetical protein
MVGHVLSILRNRFPLYPLHNRVVGPIMESMRTFRVGLISEWNSGVL